VPWSSADTTVHFPVPFCPALSRIDYRLALCITVSQDVAGDLDEVRFQDARIPPPEDGAHRVVAQSQALFHELIGFGDDLHVAILDAVVHHFDEVAGAVFTHPVAAGHAERIPLGDPRRDRLEDRLDVRPGRGRAAGHQGWPMPRALLAAGDAAADIEQPLRLDISRPANRVLVVGVAAVDDNVARFQQQDQLFDEVVHRLPGFHQQHHAPRPLQRRHQLRQGMRADDGHPLGGARNKCIDHGGRAVVHGHGEAVVGHVQYQVLPHHGQADEGDVCLGHV
jgi:hypothetical protein